MEEGDKWKIDVKNWVACRCLLSTVLRLALSFFLTVHYKVERGGGGMVEPELRSTVPLTCFAARNAFLNVKGDVSGTSLI